MNPQRNNRAGTARSGLTAPAIPKQPTHEAESLAEAVRLLQRQSASATDAALAQPLCVTHPALAAADATVLALAYGARRVTYRQLGLVFSAAVTPNAADFKTFDLTTVNVSTGIRKPVATQAKTAAVGFGAYAVRWFQGLSATLAEGELLVLSVDKQGAGVALPAFAVVGV